ncbi:site-specific integrase [Photobacterium aquimaris]|uniref:Site-specific integrase n=1 Tax=Photobacterium aquimaris TaxID=512643 RepID=A0A2T3HU02_9GAMM|nr:site-specific integrase [Photobacterium aquimaris]OBU24347.1 site-specific recombinase [Photobacterium aquimaris]PQJ40465.1 site-specific recombinase [Photobacterium aquimaris]PST99337.1 site-specific integrase [Photobacterium aquimaris]
MSTVVIANQPNLGSILTSSRIAERSKCKLPMIITKEGMFDWNANAFITHIGGGASVYNIKPLATTVIKKAYNLNLFCSFLENEKINVYDVNDSTLYEYIEHLKDRGIFDDTIIKHIRVALEYIVYLSRRQPEVMLATSYKEDTGGYKVHYQNKKITRGGIEIPYLTHHCLKGLIHISSDIEFIRDYQLEMWLDAINCTTYHPNIDDFLLSRWQAFTTLLDITGSRITEVHQITRSIIKESAKNLLSTKVPILRQIPIMKGKYKGKKREVETTKEDIQVLLWHIEMVENMFPDIKHDAIFVDLRTGKALKATYLKNYAKKVINGSKYCRDLRHLTNHSFRHRFITLRVAKSIKKLAESGSFHNILTVAANACRKVTMHASNDTLSRYIHIANEINEPDSDQSVERAPISTQIKVRVKHMLKIADSLKSDEIGEKEALDSLLTTLSELRRLSN